MAPDAPDETGSGWRIRGGVLESAVAGLRVEAPEEWRILAGAEAEAADPNADLGLVRADPDLVLTVNAQHTIGTTPAERKEEMLAVASLGKVRLAGGRPVAVRSGEVSFRMEPWTDRKGAVILWIGGFPGEDRAFCVTVRCPAYQREEGERAFPEAVGALRLMKGRERDALTAELLAVPDTQCAYEAGISLRRGVLRDFGHGVIWRLPAGFWSVYLHDPKAADEPYEKNLVATITDRALDIEGTLEVHPGVTRDLPAFQEEMVSWFIDQSEGAGGGGGPAAGGAPEGGPAGGGAKAGEKKSVVEPARTVDFCGAKGLSTRVHDGEGWEWIVVSTLRGKDGVSAWFNGGEAAMDAAAGTIGAALAGVSSDPSLREDLVEGAHYANLKYGFSLELPRADFPAMTVIPVPATSRGMGRQWQDGALRIIVEADRRPPGSRGLTFYFDRRPAGSKEDPVGLVSSMATLGGRPCVLTERWGGPRSVQFNGERDGTVFWLFIDGPKGFPDEAVERIRAGFRFLE